MITKITEKQNKEHLKKLLKFCKKNQVLVWNFMLMVQDIRNEIEQEPQSHAEKQLDKFIENRKKEQKKNENNKRIRRTIKCN